MRGELKFLRLRLRTLRSCQIIQIPVAAEKIFQTHLQNIVIESFSFIVEARKLLRNSVELFLALAGILERNFLRAAAATTLDEEEEEKFDGKDGKEDVEVVIGEEVQVLASAVHVRRAVVSRDVFHPVDRCVERSFWLIAIAPRDCFCILAESGKKEKNARK